MATHEVFNQPPPLVDVNVYRSDRALVETVERERGATPPELEQIGELAGSAECLQWGVDANAYPPELHTHDRYGHRIDEVTFHPAWFKLLQVATRFGLHGTPWGEDEPGAHALRAAKFFVWAQVEAGHGCPISMTYAAVPALRAQLEVARVWEPLLVTREYDRRLVPVAQKRSALTGMAMTEKQGGSDLRANATRATFAERTPLGDAYLL
ncbi:MAG: DNA alkylation response protein, partial [Rhodanobacteraceae bacterium]